MDDHDRARLAKLLQRQQRKARTPAVLRAWEKNGVSVKLLPDDRHEELVSWLRANWDPPHEAVADIGDHLRTIIGEEDLVIVMNFWDWDEAVAVLAPATGLLRIKSKLRQIYPDGLLLADQRLRSALIVGFDDHADGAEVSMIGSERKA
jgi:hypothetical protein